MKNARLDHFYLFSKIFISNIIGISRLAVTYIPNMLKTSNKYKIFASIRRKI